MPLLAQLQHIISQGNLSASNLGQATTLAATAAASSANVSTAAPLPPPLPLAAPAPAAATLLPYDPNALPLEPVPDRNIDKEIEIPNTVTNWRHGDEMTQRWWRYAENPAP